MENFTQGSTRVVLQQPDLTTFQGNGSVVLDSRRTRPLWFDGRFLAAKDLEREQNYFLQRQADLGQAGGFGVMHGLMVDQGPSTGQPTDAETIVIHAGDGITPAGELVMLPNDLTIRLSDLAEELNLDVQFGISSAPQQPARTRSGLYVIALRPVEFTANPITSYPTSIQGSRTTHDGDIVEATAVSLVPYPNPVSNPAVSQVQAALARQIFVAGNPGTLSDSLLPLAMVSITRGAIDWIDDYLVRRDSGPQFSGVRFGLTDPATQQAFLLQYNAQLQSIVAARQSGGLKSNFAATDFFQALPPAGPFPLDGIDTNVFTQVFFPQQMDVRLSIIPNDELPALVQDSMALPPIDLTLPASAFANLSVFALIPVPRNLFASLKNSLPDTPLQPTMPQLLANRSPLQLLKLFQGVMSFLPAPPVANSAWNIAIGTQKFGFYVRRRSQAIFVDFTSVALSSSQNPSIFGQPVTFTAKVTPPSATGTIQFNDGNTPLGQPVIISAGSASLTVATLSGGAHAITAIYSGDAENDGSTSAILTQTVSVPANVSLSSSLNPSTFGQSVTFTATVLPSSATGTIQFNDGNTTLGTQPLSSGSASLPVSTLSAGVHSITAFYGGDANDAPNTSPALSQTVNRVASSVTVVSSLPSAPFGQSVTLTATVTPASATGTVTFTYQLSPSGPLVTLGAAPVSGGKAPLPLPSLAVGTYPITASYGGDASDAPSASAVLTQTIVAAPTGVVVSSAPNPSIVGQSVVFTASVTPNTATGTVQFVDGATNVGSPVTLATGQATLPVTTLAVGAHPITAAYSGDGNNAKSTSPAMTQTVNQIASTVALASAPSPSTIGQSVALTATVAPASATGNVQFKDGPNNLGNPVPLSAGKAALSVTTLTVGAHSLTAAYAGDTNDAQATSAVVTQTVNLIATSVAVTSSQNPATIGQSVSFTATVTPATATGTVQFKDGPTNLGTAVTISAGKAVSAAVAPSLGSHSITAVYSGDSNDAAATSPALVQNVNQATSSTAVSSSVNPSTFGQSVTFTAAVTPATASGTIQFKDGANNLGAPAPLSSGKATLPVTTLSVGTHSITAVYGGDANDTASTSPAITQTVNQAASSVAVTSSQNPATAGQQVTLTAAVTPASATGTVQFRDGTANLGTAVTLSGGQAPLPLTSLAVGTHSITAVYSGDTNDTAATSPAFTQTVNLIATSTVVASSQSSSTAGQSVTFTATVTPTAVTGAVQFRDGAANLGTAVTLSGGKAVLPAQNLAAGTHSITAVYSGDANDAGSTSPAVTQTVNLVATSVAVTGSPTSSTFGQSVTLTATVTPKSATGTVQFKDGTANLGSAAAVSGGVATLPVTTLTAGSHSITGAYSGDANDAASTSPAVTLTVNKAATSVVVTASPAPNGTQLTATITPATATGTVQFVANGANTGNPATVTSGKATIVAVLGAAAPSTVIANYSGDANFLPSTSPAITA